MILQEGVEPYNVVGLFESKGDADRFIQQYAQRYGLEDASHLEKYRADPHYEGQGPVFEETDSIDSNTEETEQADFTGFL